VIGQALTTYRTLTRDDLRSDRNNIEPDSKRVLQRV